MAAKGTLTKQRSAGAGAHARRAGDAGRRAAGAAIDRARRAVPGRGRRRESVPRRVIGRLRGLLPSSARGRTLIGLAGAGTAGAVAFLTRRRGAHRAAEAPPPAAAGHDPGREHPADAPAAVERPGNGSPAMKPRAVE